MIGAQAVQRLIAAMAENLKIRLDERGIDNPAMVGIHTGGVWVAAMGGPAGGDSGGRPGACDSATCRTPPPKATGHLPFWKAAPRVWRLAWPG